MRKHCFILLASIGLLLGSGLLFAQTKEEEPAANLTSKSVPAIGYEIGAGATKINLVATSAASGASGEARVEAKKAGTIVEVKVKGMPQPTTLGPEFLRTCCGTSPRTAGRIILANSRSTRMARAS